MQDLVVYLLVKRYGPRFAVRDVSFAVDGRAAGLTLARRVAGYS
jgi:hypothetical protein